MKSITIAGNIGKDAETRTTQGGDSVTGFSVAVSTGKDSPPMWFGVSLWGKRGAALKPYLTKGAKVVVSGDLTTREHEGKTYLDVRADQITPFFGGTEARKEEPQAGSGRGFSDDLSDEIPFAPEWR